MNKKYILILALVAVASAATINMPEEEEAMNEVAETSIDELEDDEEVSVKASPPYDLRYMNALDAHINKVIKSNFHNQPGKTSLTYNINLIIIEFLLIVVIQLLYLWTDGSRVLKIKKMNGGTLRQENKLLQSINMGNGRASKTGRYIAYRPRFSGHHHSRLGAIFVNLNRLFPCARSTQVLCRRFTIEEDGFLKGRSVIEAADFGNNFRAFGNNVDTYGIAFQGCPYLNGVNGCLPSWFHTTIACLLPRSCS